MMRRGKYRVALVAIAMMQAVLVLDEGVVPILAPHMTSDFNLGSAQVSLASASFMVPFGACLIFAGSIADRVGRLKIFTFACLAFAISSALCALSGTLWLFFAGRVLQGLSAAFVSPSALGLIVGTAASEKERNIGLGIWGVASGVGGLLGMLGAGAITQIGSWHWVFLINIPLSLTGIIVVRCTVQVGPPQTDRVPLPGILSTIILLFGLGLFAAGVAWTSSPDTVFATPATALGACGIILFFILQRRERHRLIPLHQLRSRHQVIGLIAILLMSGSFTALFYAISFQTQQVWGWGPLASGATLAIQALVSFIFFPIAARLVSQRDTLSILSVGLLICTFGAAFIWLAAAASWVVLIVGILFLGIGTSLALLAASSAVVGASPAASAVAATFTASQQLGNAAGFAVLVAATSFFYTDGLHNGILALFSAVVLGLLAIGILVSRRFISPSESFKRASSRF